MQMNDQISHKLIRIKGVPLKLIFNDDGYQIVQQKKSQKIPETFLKNEVLTDLMKIIKSINFTVSR
jgi:hypothetical protein